MKKIELLSATVEDNAIRYQVREDKGLGLLQREVVDLFIRFHGDKKYEIELNAVPQSILMLPISLYLLPITYFYNVELVIPEMDKVLFSRLPAIYDAYSRIYGPFKNEWRGNVSVGRIVENTPIETSKYDKGIFFSGGVDACHAAINNPGKKSLLISIPDIERDAKNEGALRNEKFSLIKRFSQVVKSDWLLISNNFNSTLYKDGIIESFLRNKRCLDSPAFNFDGFGGIRYLANMCCVAPIAYSTGITSLVMGSSFEQIEDKMNLNLDGAHPDLTNAIGFSNIIFSEQEGLLVRRSMKTKNIIEWCKNKGVTTKLWACFSDKSTQCGYCNKCIRTQLNILCAGENPKSWGFDDFSESKFTKYVKSYKYCEFNPCWLWDNIETIEDNRIYPYCNDLLHWLKGIGYKEYSAIAFKTTVRDAKIKKLLSVHRYPYYMKVILSRLINRK